MAAQQYQRVFEDSILWDSFLFMTLLSGKMKSNGIFETYTLADNSV